MNAKEALNYLKINHKCFICNNLLIHNQCMSNIHSNYIIYFKNVLFHLDNNTKTDALFLDVSIDNNCDVMINNDKGYLDRLELQFSLNVSDIDFSSLANIDNFFIKIRKMLVFV